MVLGMSLVRGFLASTGSQVIVLVDWWLSLMSLARHYEGLTPLSKDATQKTSHRVSSPHAVACPWRGLIIPPRNESAFNRSPVETYYPPCT